MDAVRHARLSGEHRRAARLALLQTTANRHSTLRQRQACARELAHAAYRVANTTVKRYAQLALESVALDPGFEDNPQMSGKERGETLEFIYWLLPQAVLPLTQFAFQPLAPTTIRSLYRPLNPSIQRVPRGYLVNVRTVNFERDAACTRYESREGDGVVKTRNIHVRLTRDLRPDPDEKEVDVDVPQGMINYTERSDVQGLEDARVVIANDAAKTRWLTATVYGIARQPGICLARIGPRGVVETVRRLTGYHDDECQKSWLPFFDGAQLRCVYGYHPRLVLLDIDPVSARVSVRREVQLGCNAYRFRGSGGPVFARGSIYVLVHEVLWHGGRRTYTHRLLELDERRWTLKRLTPMFCFRHVGVEYAAGLAPLHGDVGLVATFGFDDREAWLVPLPWAWIDDRLADTDSLLAS